MKHLHKLFIFVLLFLLPLNTAFALLQIPFCPPGTHGFWPDCVPDAPPDPVIVIPGITGSWNWNVLFRDAAPTLENWDFPPLTNIYEPLISALRNEYTNQGLDPNKNVFVAFYDWRQPNVLSSQDYLKPIIEKAKFESGKGRVDIVAHSMGGILARAYIQGGHYDNDVDQFITLGTPHFGSGDVYDIWAGGHIPNNWDLTQKVLFFAYFFLTSKDVTDDQTYETVRNSLLSIRDLLPTYNYLKDKTTNNLLQTTTLQEQNVTLNTFNANINDLSFLVNSMTTIAGNNESTVGEIPVTEREDGEEPLWRDGKPDPLDPIRNASGGDNRVLLSSAHIQQIVDQVTLDNAKHADLPSKAAQTVFDRLEFDDPGTLALVPEPDDVLSFMFASPVMPTVTDPNGKLITNSTSTIPGAIYFGEPNPQGLKMILIPNPVAGVYKVDLLGNGNGYYDFASSYFKQDAPDSMRSFSGEVVEDQTISYLANLLTCSPDHVSTCSPLSTEKLDTDPPIITITLPENNKAYRNDGTLKIQYAITDESEIGNQSSKLDNSAVSNNQTIDLSLFKLGNHAFTVAATDVAGNSSQSTVEFTTFVTHESLKNNINHYLALKLIKTKGLAQALMVLVDTHKAAKTLVAKNAILKAFEIAVQTALKTKLILQPAGNLLIEQMKAL